MTVALAAITLGGGLVPLGVAYAGKRIVDAVVAHSRDATLRWVARRARRSSWRSALVQRGLALVRSLLGARLGHRHQRHDPREGARARPALLRGPRVLRQAHARPARGVVAPDRARDRELRPRAERPHARRVRRAARSLQRLGGARARASRRSRRPSPRCASRSSRFASATGARPSRAGCSTSSTSSRTTSTRRR